MSFRPFRGNADNWVGRGRGGGPRGFNLGNQDDDDDEPYTKRERSPVRVIRRTRIDDNDDDASAPGGPGPERGRPFQRGRGGSNFERGGRGSWNRGRGGGGNFGQNSGFRNQDDQDSFRQENEPVPMPIKRDAFDDQGLGNGGMNPGFMARRNLMSKPVEVPKTTWELNQEEWGIPSYGNEKRGNDSKSPWNSKPNPDRPSLLKPNYLAGSENSSNRPGQLPSLMSQPIMNPATPGSSIGMMQGNSNPWVRQGNTAVPQNNLTQWNAGGLMGMPQPLMAQPPFQNPNPLMIAPNQPNFGHNSNPMDGAAQVTPNFNPNNAPAFYSGNIPSNQDPGGASPRVPPPPPKLNNSSRFISKPPVRYFNVMESPEKSSIASEASSVEVVGTKRRNENTSHSAPPPPPPTLDKPKLTPSSEKVPTDPFVDLFETEEEDIETKFMELSTTHDLMQVTTKPRWRNTAQGVKHYAFNIQFEYKDQHIEVEGSYVKELKKAREEAYGLACQKVKSLVEVKEEITSTNDKSKPVGGTMQREYTAADVQAKSGLSKSFRSRDSWSHQSAGSEVASKSNLVSTEPKKTPFVPLQRPPPPPPPKIGTEIRVGQQIDDSDFQSFDDGKKTSLQAQKPELIDEVIHLSRKRPFHSTAGTGSAFEERFKQYMDVLHMRCWLTPKRKTERSLRLTTYEIKIESFDGQFNTQYSGDPFLTDALAKEHAFETACRGLEKIFPDVGRHGGAGEESTKQTEFDELRLKLRMEFRSYPDLKIEKNGAKMYGYNIEIYRGSERETVYGTFYPDEKHAKAATFEAAYHRLKYRYGPELDRLKNSQSANDLSRVSPSRTPIYNGEDDDEQDQPSVEWQSTSVNNPTNDRNTGNRVTSPSFAFVSPMQKPTTFTNLFRQQPPPPPPPPPRNNVMQGSGPPPTPRQDCFEPPPTPRDDFHSYNHSQNSFQNISNDGKLTFESRFLEYTRLLNIEYNFRLIPQFEAGYRIYAGEIKYQSQSGRFSPNIVMGEYYRDEQQARENAFKFAFEELDIKFKRQMNMMGVNTPKAPLTFGGSGRFMGR